MRDHPGGEVRGRDLRLHHPDQVLQVAQRGLQAERQEVHPSERVRRGVR